MTTTPTPPLALPALPEPSMPRGEFPHFMVKSARDLFDADQMNAHATAAILSDRAGRGDAAGWVSVEDRLPDSSRRVLACNPLGYVGAAQYANGHWNGIGGASGWMELPKPIAAPTGEAS